MAVSGLVIAAIQVEPDGCLGVQQVLQESGFLQLHASLLLAPAYGL